MSAYASTIDLGALFPALAPADPVLLLEQASRDIDSVLPATWGLEENGLKLGTLTGEKGLSAGQVVAVVRATCAQAEYRDTMGPEFFVQGQFDTVTGPDFSHSGKLPYVGPKALNELIVAGLVSAPEDVGSGMGTIKIGTTLT